MPQKKTSTEPVIVRGSHSIRTEYPDGRVEFETIWEELVNDVNAALRDYEANGSAPDPMPAKKPARKTATKKK